MQKGSPKRTKKTRRDVIVIKLTEEQKKKVSESLRQQDLGKFKIEEIEVRVIPTARVKNHIYID